jgi:hypothetical protein
LRPFRPDGRKLLEGLVLLIEVRSMIVGHTPVSLGSAERRSGPCVHRHTGLQSREKKPK